MGKGEREMERQDGRGEGVGRGAYLGSSSIFSAGVAPGVPAVFCASSASLSSLCFRLSSFSTHPPYRELLPSSITSLTPPTALLKALVSRTGRVAFSIPLPVALTPVLTPFTTVLSHVHAAP